jgi:hypothetical protein
MIMKTFEKWLEEELKEINLGDVSEHEEGLLRGAYEAGVNAHKESVATVLCSVGLEGDDCKEASARMDKKEALAVMAGANDWLRKKLNKGANCSCGACYLCAYRFIEKAL